MTITNLETWCEAFINEMAPIFEGHGHKVPKCRYSIGFTSKGRSQKVIGECWNANLTADKVSEIFILCNTDDSEAIAATLVHEVIHAILGHGVGHKAPFVKLARLMHLEGKPTATHGGEAFKQMIAPALAKLGPIPHKALDFSKADGPKKQTTRLVKVKCPGCEFSVRMTRTWLDDEDYGPVVCPCCKFLCEEAPEKE